MTSEESLRSLIREKLQNVSLPGDDCTKVFGGVANGEICDACSEAIAKNQLLMECIGEHYPKYLSASHAARCVAYHGVRSHPVPVALVSELLRAVRFIRS
jgi:hypothetical protein